jgi:peptidoglycan/xylan/chitin deacetylase (PgdA/CDA1 family)
MGTLEHKQTHGSLQPNTNMIPLLVFLCAQLVASAPVKRQSCSLLVSDFSGSITSNNLGLYQSDDGSMASKTLSGGKMTLVPKSSGQGYFYTNVGCPSTLYSSVSLSISCQTGSFRVELQAGTSCGNAKPYYSNALTCSPTESTVTVPFSSFGLGSVVVKSVVLYGLIGSTTIDNVVLGCSGTVSTSTVQPTSIKPTSTINPTVTAGQVFSTCAPGLVAITFDDGPWINDLSLLDTLARLGVPATFFVNGNNWNLIDAMVEELQAMYNRGHEVLSHTWSHPSMPSLSDSQIQDQMLKLEAKLKQYLGVVPQLMRPPFGEWNERVRTVMAKLGYSLVLWNLDSFDWSLQDANAQLKFVQDSLQGTDPSKDGFILLNHDTVDSTVYGGIEKIVLDLRSRGYKFVKVSECVGVSPYKS